MIVYQQWNLQSQITFLTLFFLMNKVSWHFCRSSDFRGVLGLTGDEGRKAVQRWLSCESGLDLFSFNLCRHQTISKSNTYCLYWSALTRYTLWGPAMLSVPSAWAERVVRSEEPGLFLDTFSHLLMSSEINLPWNSVKWQGGSWTRSNEPCAVFSLAPTPESCWPGRCDLANRRLFFHAARGHGHARRYGVFVLCASRPCVIPGARQLQQSRCNQEGVKSPAGWWHFLFTSFSPPKLSVITWEDEAASEKWVLWLFFFSLSHHWRSHYHPGVRGGTTQMHKAN